MALQADASPAGSAIDLRFEMDTLVILHTCPHPMNNASQYPLRPVTFSLLQSEPVTEDDFCKNACAENKRGFENNTLYNLAGQS